MTDTLARSVTEAQLQHTVVTMAEYLGYECWHDNDSRRNKAGLPDLLCVKPATDATPGAVYWFELKTMRGRLRPAQRYWIDLLRGAGEQVYVVRPSDVDAVERLLRGEIETLEDAR